MKNTIPKTLVIASTSYAGMGPYVAAIVNSFEKDDNVRFFLVEREDNYYTRNIKEELKPLCTIYQEKTPGKIQTLLEISFNRKPPYLDILKDLCKSEKIEIVHFISSLHNKRLSDFLKNNHRLLYTVHDLHPHESKKAFYKELRQNILYKRMFEIMDSSNNFYTNSLAQLEELQRKYPDKDSFYTPFPSLVTKEIKEGDKLVPELRGIKDYVLFFGRIEAYKGLDILVHAFRSASLPDSIKLVIAGKGEMPGVSEDSRIIFINRYIDDKEIRSLYKNAGCVVYPYISATQSGVLSIASYFGTPIITSDLPFFKEVLGSQYEYLFHSEDEIQLKCKLQDFYQGSSDILSSFSNDIYKKQYRLDGLRKELLSIYSKINK